MEENKKYKKVVRTKHPSIKQINSMVYNLGEKYDRYSSVSLNSKTAGVNFWSYIESIHCEEHQTWQSLQDKYFELMEKANG